VGHVSRREQRVTGVECETLVTHFHQELARDDVEPLVLVVVEMPRRATLRVESVLKHEEAVAALPGHLELDRAHAQPARLAVAIGARRDTNDGRRMHGTLIHRYLPPGRRRWP